jgi:hypothetical protein
MVKSNWEISDIITCVCIASELHQHVSPARQQKSPHRETEAYLSLSDLVLWQRFEPKAVKAHRLPMQQLLPAQVFESLSTLIQKVFTPLVHPGHSITTQTASVFNFTSMDPCHPSELGFSTSTPANENS